MLRSGKQCGTGCNATIASASGSFGSAQAQVGQLRSSSSRPHCGSVQQDDLSRNSDLSYPGALIAGAKYGSPPP